MMELIYTSAPRGLFPGRFGFCTVAVTAGMSAPMVQRLESLSGYRPLYRAGHPRSDENPVSYAHWRIEQGGESYSVLSAVRYAGADYSGRTNKLAHHRVVEPAERVSPGPAWCLLQEGVVRDAWEGPPQQLPPGSPLPGGSRPAGICHAWEQATGDAGWAGTLVDAFLLDPDQPAYLIYEPGSDVLGLIEEAIALLPPQRRWDVTFDTYFHQLPSGQNCTWRCCVAGTPAAEEAAERATSGVLIDLTRAPLELDRHSRYIEKARTGLLPPPAADEGAPAPGRAQTARPTIPLASEPEPAPATPVRRATPRPAPAAAPASGGGRRLLLTSIAVAVPALLLGSLMPWGWQAAETPAGPDPQVQRAEQENRNLETQIEKLRVSRAQLEALRGEKLDLQARLDDQRRELERLRREQAAALVREEARRQQAQPESAATAAEPADPSPGETAEPAEPEADRPSDRLGARQLGEGRYWAKRPPLPRPGESAGEPLLAGAVLEDVRLQLGRPLARENFEAEPQAGRVVVSQPGKGTLGAALPVAALSAADLGWSWEPVDGGDARYQQQLRRGLRYATIRGELGGRRVLVQFSEPAVVSVPVGGRQTVLAADAGGASLPPMMLEVADCPAGWQGERTAWNRVVLAGHGTRLELQLRYAGGAVQAETRWLAGGPAELRAKIAARRELLSDLREEQSALRQSMADLNKTMEKRRSPDQVKSAAARVERLAASLEELVDGQNGIAELEARLERLARFEASVRLKADDTDALLATIELRSQSAEAGDRS